MTQRHEQRKFTSASSLRSRANQTLSCAPRTHSHLILKLRLRPRVRHDPVALHEPLHQDVARGKVVHGLGEVHPVVLLEVHPEAGEVLGLAAEVELRDHDLTELLDAVGHGQVLEIEAGEGLEEARDLVEDVEVQLHLLADVRMDDLHGDLQQRQRAK